MAQGITAMIVEQSLSLDNNASFIYQKLAQNAESSDIRAFWTAIACENEKHILYWNKLLILAQKKLLENVFQDAESVLDELKELGYKVSDLAAKSDRVHDIKNAFTIAFKLEFYLLHPAFEALSQHMSSFTQDRVSEIRYKRFVNRLFEALNQYGLATMEFELVGETIHRIWKENRRMAFLSNYDELTGILNRRGLFNAIDHLAHLAQRNANTVGLLMIDIDHFKKLNDELGHQAGDEVLRDVALTIQSGIRASDTVGRYGGEEFLVFLSRVDRVSLKEVGEKIRQSVQAMDKYKRRITVSVGISSGMVGRDVERDVKYLVKIADEKLYMAKSTGRNKVVQ